MRVADWTDRTDDGTGLRRLVADATGPLTVARCDLQDADLRDCVLDGCDLLHADLFEARLDGADLRGAGLGPCDLDRLRALGGALITPAQATRIVEELAGVRVIDPA